MDELREELDKIANNLDEQEKLVENYNIKFKRSIRHSSRCSCNIRFPQICHTFSLGLSDEETKEYAEKCNFTNLIFDLTKNKEIKDSNKSKNSLALYFLKDKIYPKHSGVFNNNLVESKWGGGHIWIHLPEECPIKYGTPRYYKRPSKQDVFRALENYDDYASGFYKLDRKNLRG